jgi:hypothetical protein
VFNSETHGIKIWRKVMVLRLKLKGKRLKLLYQSGDGTRLCLFRYVIMLNIITNTNRPRLFTVSWLRPAGFCGRFG